MQAEHGLEFPLILASAEDVPLPDDCADLVLSEYGASLWCEPDAWLAEAARLLRPGRAARVPHEPRAGHAHVAVERPGRRPAGARRSARSRGCSSTTTTRVEFHLVARRLDRDAGAARLHASTALHELYAPDDARDEQRFDWMTRRVGAALAARGALDRPAQRGILSASTARGEREAGLVAALEHVDAAAARDDAEPVARRRQVRQPAPAARARVEQLDLADRARRPPPRPTTTIRPPTVAAPMPPRGLRIGGALRQRAARGSYASTTAKLPTPRRAAGERVEAAAGDRAREVLARDRHVRAACASGGVRKS